MSLVAVLELIVWKVKRKGQRGGVLGGFEEKEVVREGEKSGNKKNGFPHSK